MIGKSRQVRTCCTHRCGRMCDSSSALRQVVHTPQPHTLTPQHKPRPQNHGFPKARPVASLTHIQHTRRPYPPPKKAHMHAPERHLGYTPAQQHHNTSQMRGTGLVRCWCVAQQTAKHQKNVCRVPQLRQMCANSLAPHLSTSAHACMHARRHSLFPAAVLYMCVCLPCAMVMAAWHSNKTGGRRHGCSSSSK